jgi:hypothetical protein
MGRVCAYFAANTIGFFGSLGAGVLSIERTCEKPSASTAA